MESKPSFLSVNMETSFDTTNVKAMQFQPKQKIKHISQLKAIVSVVNQILLPDYLAPT